MSKEERACKMCVASQHAMKRGAAWVRHFVAGRHIASPLINNYLACQTIVV